MEATIWKHVLTPGSNVLSLPSTSTTLSIGWQGEQLVMWVLMLDPGFAHQRIERRFLVVVTGETFERLNTDKYVGTAVCGRSGIVLHVFEAKSKTTNPSARAVNKLMNKKVDVHTLCYIEHPSLYEKLVLELSTEIEKQRNADYAAVSWASQVEAADYFNKHGFVDTLTHMLSLRDKFEKENKTNE